MPDTDTDDITRLRIAVARIARAVDRQVSGDGLTRTQLSVLGTVARLGPLGAGELADIEGLNPTMLSRVSGKLEQAGLIVRVPDPADGRAIQLTVTRSGRTLHRRLRRERSELFAARLATLDRTQNIALVAAVPALEALAEAMLRAPAGARR